MATWDYWHAKNEVLKFLDDEKPDLAVLKNYLEPPEKPTYKAATKMAEIGLGGPSLQEALPRLNAWMKKRYGGLWSPKLGPYSTKAVDTIGDLIKLVAARLKFGLPNKDEPT